MTTLKVPSVHLNGTSKQELLNQYRNAYHDIATAIRTLQQACPHGRDYYLQPAGSYEQARIEHVKRLARLESVQDELEAIAIELQK